MTRVPADTGKRPYAQLAEHLTALRRAARLTQRALAQAASISRGAVQGAESGTAAPTPAVLKAYVGACRGRGKDVVRAEFLRARGRTAERDRLPRIQAPHPTLIRTAGDLGAALAAAYELAGAPPLRSLNLDGHTRLPLATASRIVNRKSLPATAGQLVTFLTACKVLPAQQRPYIDAYHRITGSRRARPAPPGARRTSQRVRPGPLPYYDISGITAGIKALASMIDQMDVRPEKFTPGVEAALAVSRSLDQEAHRNGRSLPEHLAAGLQGIAQALPRYRPPASS
ncbi:helix-turn-helix transcriptional regulator [Streptomyces longwoodensis]|uniref:helix-turn-helix domain-containing protein n=1 Tax=Streptomyces longwoodensis TaxID=68231 RepID=UPI002E80445F|nr:helix-turn-helix transcriptional regulator [Streptomyces longwoodensis]WUC55754.1 helix-turn-helix transcriptional regulator [Streptomyces longwoodensis]WUC62127.1 helix-turn-helix transcriptional regulator [Streptomyces longwoodensis]